MQRISTSWDQPWRREETSQRSKGCPRDSIEHEEGLSRWPLQMRALNSIPILLGDSSFLSVRKWVLKGAWVMCLEFAVLSFNSPQEMTIPLWNVRWTSYFASDSCPTAYQEDFVDGKLWARHRLQALSCPCHLRDCRLSWRAWLDRRPHQYYNWADGYRLFCSTHDSWGSDPLSFLLLMDTGPFSGVLLCLS